MPTLKPRNVHVLFVHGVGTHSRLSSLLRPYQALRTNTRNRETAVEVEDLSPDWHLQIFDDGSEIPYLKLQSPGEEPGATDTIYLYEVNYSELAGVVRKNHPLDLTDLFVGFDLAINVARARLKKTPVNASPASSLDIDHASLALTVQRLAGVMVAATVPILGIPSLFLRQFAKTPVAVFSRFFEDIATFALDRIGEQLIAAHVDRKVASIFDSEQFNKIGDEKYSKDAFVIVAHSLGTVVAHGFIVRHGMGSGEHLPARLLTFGSPIGLVLWLWLFLDFEGMDISKRQVDNARYFTWDILVRKKTLMSLPPMLWINVINHLDPIATAFPTDYSNIAQSSGENAESLDGGKVLHRFIRTGDSPASAHTAYFDDRIGFLKILGRISGLVPGRPQDLLDPAAPLVSDAPTPRSAEQHWGEGIEALLWLRVCLWIVGLAAIGIYLGAIAWVTDSWGLMWLLVLFGWPPLTVEVLALCQRFICGRPTKRSSSTTIKGLPWLDLWSFPHRLRQWFRRKQTQKEEETEVLGSGPSLGRKLGMGLLSLLPTFLAMLTPFLVLSYFRDFQTVAILVTEYWQWGIFLLLVFFIYTSAFSLSEFASHWRTAINKTSRI